MNTLYIPPSSGRGFPGCRRLLKGDCQRCLDSAPVTEDPVEGFFQPVMEGAADTGVLHPDVDSVFIYIDDFRVPEKHPHYRRKRGDLAADGVAVLLHQPPGGIHGGKCVVLFKKDLDRAPFKELFFHFTLHPEDPVLVDQVFRTQADLESCPLTIGSKALHLCICKIILQILPDLQLRKDLKKRFGHTVYISVIRVNDRTVPDRNCS